MVGEGVSDDFVLQGIWHRYGEDMAGHSNESYVITMGP